MRPTLFWILMISILFFSSCRSQTKKDKNIDAVQNTQPENNDQPNYNYVIEIPTGWTVRDTIMQDGLKIRFLLAPESLNVDLPRGNILISYMEGRKIDDFTTRNINYLKSNMPGISIFERGSIDSSRYNGQWFTYSKEQNGTVRDMINYIIPVNGFAYMITCGTNAGSMKKYRAAFDKIAISFKG